MLIKSTTTAGFQCPSCGNIQSRELHCFHFGGTGAHEILCNSCGRKVAVLQRKKKGQIQLKVDCLDCYDEHMFPLRPGLFWQTPLKAFQCCETQETIFLIGEADLVDEAMQRAFYLNSDDEQNYQMPKKPEELGAFDTVEDVMELIGHFQKLAAEGKIFCSCGEYYLEMKIERDIVRFICPGCGNERILDISTKEKVEQIRRLEEIRLT